MDFFCKIKRFLIVSVLPTDISTSTTSRIICMVLVPQSPHIESLAASNFPCYEWHALRPHSPLQSFQMIQKKTLVIKQHLTHLETVKLRAFSHECERFGSEISLAPLAAAAADEPKMRGFPRFWIISLTRHTHLIINKTKKTTSYLVVV